MKTRELLGELRSGLEYIDDQIKRASKRETYVELLVMRSNCIKVKIYQEKRHPLPHVHIDYGKINHAASYSIDPPACLEGKIKSVHDAFVIAWITKHRDSLLALWTRVQAGELMEPVLLELE